MKAANAVIEERTTVHAGDARAFCPGSDPDRPQPHALNVGDEVVIVRPAVISGARIAPAVGIGITFCSKHRAEQFEAERKQNGKSKNAKTNRGQ